MSARQRHCAARWTEAQVGQVAQMLRDGLSGSEIGRKMGVERNTIVGRVHRNKVLKAIGFARQSYNPQCQKVKKARPEGQPAPKGKEQNNLAWRVGRAKNTGGLEAVNAVRSVERQKASPGLPAVTTPDAATYDATALKVQLVDLGSLSCKWFVGDPLDGEGGFCGHTRLLPHSYCAPHAKRAAPGLFICAEALAA